MMKALSGDLGEGLTRYVSLTISMARISACPVIRVECFSSSNYRSLKLETGNMQLPAEPIGKAGSSSRNSSADEGGQAMDRGAKVGV